MGRISREVMFMDMARAASRRSTCFRLNVGALVVRDNNPVAIGWNGHEPGAPHCAGNECPGVVPGACGTRHAEVNALNKAQTLLLGKTRRFLDLYVTHSPCADCWEFIKRPSMNVGRVFFETPYRNTSHIDRPFTLGIFEVTPAGYVVDYHTRQVVELP